MSKTPKPPTRVQNKPPTRVQKRRVGKAVQIDDNPAQEIAYQHTVLCQTSLPYRDPGEGVRVWERRQGAVALRLEAGAARDPRSRAYVEVGLPFGSRPRLLLAHLNAEALKNASPVIDVEDSLTAFVRRLQGFPPNGQELRRFKDQLTRFAAATVRLAVDISPSRAFQIDTKIVRAFDLWSQDAKEPMLWPSTIRLSSDYYESLQGHAVPLDERAMAALANSPQALDVYAWLAQRLHRIDPKKPQFVAWTALYDQFGHGFTRLRDFRGKFVDTLRIVQTQYPGARIEGDDRGLTLRYSAPPVLCRQSLVRLPKPED